MSLPDYNLQEKANELRAEAKRLMSNILCEILGVHPEYDEISIEIGNVDRIVDCIISCSLLEMAIIQNKAIK